MNVAVRALSALLSIWLVLAWSFPACCWSMTQAHDHQPVQAQASAGHHHDHLAAQSEALAATAALTAMPSPDCNAWRNMAIAAGNGVHAPASLKSAVRAAIADMFVPQRTRGALDAFDSAPPGSPHGSGFLNPLRI